MFTMKVCSLSVVICVAFLLDNYVGALPDPYCGKNMDPTQCNPCNQVCGQGPIACAQFCVEEPKFCRCRDGYVLPYKDANYCIPKEKCRPQYPPQGCKGNNEHKCPPNQEYTTCGSACPPTCNPPKEPVFCTQQCVIGCRCKEGFVLNSKGDCVLPSQCYSHGY